MTSLPPAQTKINNYKKVFLLLLSVWFLINLIQAIFMEPMSDEAYYWLYSKHLAWGYYDHPPMVALLIRISSVLFSGNLGIRFMTVILQLATMILIWKITDIREPDSRSVITFFIVAASICMFSAYGVITAPDSPLLFFTALFLFAYKKFIDNPKWPIVLLLMVSMTGLIYSKYQAVLVIGLTILSNIKILRSYKFWLACILSLILLIPHFNWQISNDFPSFRYHLIERSEGFRLKYFLEYLPNQMAVLNPLPLGAAIYLIFKSKPTGLFQRNLYFQIAGFLGFFWVTSIRGHVEPHWTIACSIPIIIILTEKSHENPALLRYTRKFILPSILLLLVLRIFVLTDMRYNKYLAFGGKEEKYEVLESEAKELPVVFTGAFQRPSLYTFFTGKEAMAISSLYSRQTQFDLWQFEKKYHNKTVFISSNPKGNSQIYPSDTEQFGGFITDNLQTVNRMKINFNLSQQKLHPGDSVNISFTLNNSYDFDIDFNHQQFPVDFCMVFLKDEKVQIQKVLPEKAIGIISGGKTISGRISTVMPVLAEGKYNFGLSLNNFFGPSLNSRFVKIKIVYND